MNFHLTYEIQTSSQLAGKEVLSSPLQPEMKTESQSNVIAGSIH